jgi:hypothetical protein
VLIALKRVDEAKALIRDGVAASERKRDMHTKSELEQLLEDLD